MSRISDQIRAYVNDPDVSEHYGAWGALRPDQRRLIRNLCDTCDMYEKVADSALMEREELKKAYANYEETTGLKQAKQEVIDKFVSRLKERLYAVPTVYNSHLGRMIDDVAKDMKGDKDTNDGDKVFSKEIAKLIGDNYTMSRDLKMAVKLIEDWQDEFGKLKDAKIIEGLQPIEAITSVHMLTLEKYKDTNAPTKVSSGDICVVCGEHVPEGRQICSMCETGKEFFKKRKE